MFVVSCWKSNLIYFFFILMYCQLLIRGTELPVNWPQPWWPLHASKLLWKWLKMATEFPINHHAKPSGTTYAEACYLKKECCTCDLAFGVHVVMWSSICPLHMFSAPYWFPFGWCGSGLYFLWGGSCLWVTVSFCLTQAVTTFSKEGRHLSLWQVHISAPGWSLLSWVALRVTAYVSLLWPTFYLNTRCFFV